MKTIRVKTSPASLFQVYVDLAHFHIQRGEMSAASTVIATIEDLESRHGIPDALFDEIDSLYQAGDDWQESTNPNFRVQRAAEMAAHLANLRRKRNSLGNKVRRLLGIS